MAHDVECIVSYHAGYLVLGLLAGNRPAATHFSLAIAQEK